MESARSIAASVKFAVMNGNAGNHRNDAMVIGAVEEHEGPPGPQFNPDEELEPDVVGAVSYGRPSSSNRSQQHRTGAPTQTREAWLRSRRLCIKCGLPPTEEPPEHVCPRHWKGAATGSSGKARQH
jgi:hypothetical protein